jgi:hypothetical protein
MPRGDLLATNRHGSAGRRACDDTDLIFRRYLRAKAKEPKPRPKMETFNMPRKHFMQLRDRHLHMVEEHGFGPTYNRRELAEFFLTNWNRLLGTLRKSKALEVESDRPRKSLMVGRYLTS